MILILFFLIPAANPAFSQVVEKAGQPASLPDNYSFKSERLVNNSKLPDPAVRIFPTTFNFKRQPDNLGVDESPGKKERFKFPKLETENKREKDFKDFPAPDFPKIDDPSPAANREKFHWKNAFIQSGILLGIQHASRMLQKKTTRELDGPFFRDWGNSVKGLQGWKDGDSIFINYIAHPLQGSVTGRIFINNSDRAKKQEFGRSKEYWKSRAKAAIWSTAWSIQFELGPISEASLGNVGLRKNKGRSTMAYVDLVITPTVGTGVAVAEDAIDKYILKNWLERKAGKATMKIKIFRSLFTPTMSFTNLLRGKAPWYRDYRFN